MQSICVFCGSSAGINPLYKESALELGNLLAKNKIRLVYGGGKVGLMGIVADAVLAQGGEVVGVIPQFLLDKEVGHKGLSELIVVESMHERKKIMAELSDVFIVLPGGIGTFEEFFEVLTWRQLNLHQKPIGMLNVAEYYDWLDKFLQVCVNQGFMQKSSKDFILLESQVEVLLNKILNQATNSAFSEDKI